MNIVLLTTPAQHQADNPSVLLDEKKLQKWLTELPVMNVVETVKLLHQAITPFNELQIDNQLRTRLLEHYRTSIDEIFYSYDDLRLRQLPISNEQRKAIKADIMWLYLELANGYKIVVRNALDEGNSPKKDNDMLLAVFRAMEQIIHALVNAFRNYETPPPLAYLEVNQLYLIAEQHQAEDKRVSSAKKESAVPTIANLYKQFMLLAVADPYSMNEGDAFDLFFILEQQAHLCEVLAEEPAGDQNGIYVVNLSEDSLPQPYQKLKMEQVTPDIRFIDVRNVLSVTSQRLSSLQKSEQGLMNTQEIKLFKVFQEKTTHAKAQTAGAAQPSKEVSLSFGIEATSHFMTGDNLQQHLTASKESFGIEVRDVDSEEDVEYELEHWLIAETSKTGRMLLVPRGTTNQTVAIGMLVGVYENLAEGKTPVISLGTIRWLPSDEATGHKIGLQMIPGRSQSLECSTEQGDRFHCLHVAAVEVLKLPASLLVAKANYNEGQEVTLHAGTEQISVRLEAPIEQTEHIVQCSYTRL